MVWTRRKILKSAAVGGLVGAVPLPKPLLAASVQEIALENLDPFGDPKADYMRLRHLFNTPKDVEVLVKRLWEAYARTNEFRYGHWALVYNYLWWQSLPAGMVRVRPSKIGQKMAAQLGNARADHAAGPYWQAVFFGLEALVKGVLNSLEMIPEFTRRLEQAEAVDPSYNFGGVHLAQAKLYLKVPPFPVSIGSVDKAFAYLEKARPYGEDSYGLFYVILAEAELQRRGKKAAFAALERIQDVCPTNVNARYTYEMATYLATQLREAVENETYDRYQWDPLMEPIIELRSKVYEPKRVCG